MIDHAFTIGSTKLLATGTGALWIAASQTLCVSDLHLGKAGRIARRAGLMLPPYETRDTLARLGEEIARFSPRKVICLGDSFDDLEAANELPTEAHTMLAQQQAGRDWIWIEGNHDAGPVAIGGTHVASHASDGLTFRHIATTMRGEVSGHYHPKHRLAGSGPARACFLYDVDRLIMPAFGTYTGGLSATSDTLRALFGPRRIAVLTGPRATPVPIGKTLPSQSSRGRSY